MVIRKIILLCVLLGSFNLLQSADVKKASSLYSISDAEMGARAKELGITSHELYYARTHYRKNHKTLEEFRAADKEAIEEAARSSTICTPRVI